MQKRHRRGAKLRQDEIERIIGLLKQGATPKRIVRETGVSLSKVHQIRRDRIPRLRIRSECVEITTDRGHIARYAILDIAAESRVEAVDCWGTVELSETGLIFPLHWRGINITPEESTARRILISPGMPARLDVAAALPMEDIDPDDPVVRKAAMSGQVTFMNLGSDMKYVAERRWNGAGCWLGQPGALYNPDIRLDAYVRPGTYRVNVTVGCADGEGDRREYDLVSPDSWDGLRLYRTQ